MSIPVSIKYMGDCQNYSPCWGPEYGDPKKPPISWTHKVCKQTWPFGLHLEVLGCFFSKLGCGKLGHQSQGRTQKFKIALCLLPGVQLNDQGFGQQVPACSPRWLLLMILGRRGPNCWVLPKDRRRRLDTLAPSSQSVCVCVYICVCILYIYIHIHICLFVMCYIYI